MEMPLQISFRHMDPPAGLADIIRAKASKLGTFADDILSCHVLVEPAGKHHQHGNLYQVRIDISVPGEEIVVTRSSSERSEHKDVLIALRDAFDNARRQLEDHVHRRRKLVKTHAESPHARIIRLFPEEGYGFIGTAEGREVYFHRHSVLDEDFDRLEIGAEVVFVEQDGHEGPQASTVRLVGRHGHV